MDFLPSISLQDKIKKAIIYNDDCSDPIKLDQTVVAFIATAVFIMLRHNVIDNSQD